MRRVAQSWSRVSRDFRVVADAFLVQPGLPFASVLSAERIERVFAKHGNLFGIGMIYSTAMMVWSFLSQVLRDGKEASCQAAVARVVVHQAQVGGAVPTSDTGDYCRARAKLSEAALRDLTIEVAAEVESRADEKWLWKGKHAKLVDGFTFTMPDTPANQTEYPQVSTQKVGVGFPIARACAIVSLATACVSSVAVGPYSGKKTGETALLRKQLDLFEKGDVAVMDRYYCSFLMLALLWSRGVQVCTRQHQKRRTDFRRGQRLGKYDHLVVWNKPRRPAWMDEATYAAIPATLTLREIRFSIVEPGCRTKVLTIVTTLTDQAMYSKADIAELYGFRWNSELDIRSIKQSLNLSHVRCKSPEMVRRELWTTLLGYNLIRTTAAAAGLLHNKQPRQISFTATNQYVLASWSQFSSGQVLPEEWESRCRQLLQQISECEVANRPGRVEPRVLKRRRHAYKLMQQPRATLKQQLLNN